MSATVQKKDASIVWRGKPLRAGDLLSYWHDTGALGAFGAQLCYAIVVKVGRVKIKVIGESGKAPVWKYPHWFVDRASAIDPEIAEKLRAHAARATDPRSDDKQVTP